MTKIKVVMGLDTVMLAIEGEQAGFCFTKLMTPEAAAELSVQLCQAALLVQGAGTVAEPDDFESDLNVRGYKQ